MELVPGTHDPTPGSPGVKLTYDDFVLGPDDGLRRRELIDGVEPDLLYLSNERAAKVLTAANVQGAPELVVR
jgi:hypothetical protein